MVNDNDLNADLHLFVPSTLPLVGEYNNDLRGSLRNQRMVVCHGLNADGQATVPSTAMRLSYKLAAGYKHTCALGMGGKVYCWGRDVRGEAN